MSDLETQARVKIKEVLDYTDISPIKKDRLEDKLLSLFMNEAPLYLGLIKTQVKDKSLGWLEVYLPPKPQGNKDG